ncbi:MAG: hypothetical protein A2W93_03085 [Bacteroidetes bacterium GWF2_43_63]|nr:MAG: hypothetical protein A2W94_09085 [Bacteroidetes bacterium GWE2_42_42]OFY53648.1 MAG: hypothetical protein A2W93_03085 [Bacteroidetes bacterium GWF2_43_63]HBG71011.1 hypothetical protein [Bacteroidales bacterium]HCB63589.1 hypothetical protein [Bacteroidales bacterium]HCY24338.1 hypothetical protein [Bacteroidales bacterium]
MGEISFHTTYSDNQYLFSRAKNGSQSGLQRRGRHRFGFNGKENDNEVKGTGNQQDYGMRIYDPRLGRFLSADPLIVQQQKYPELSPYQFASNMPIIAIDLDGLEAKITISGKGQTDHSTEYTKSHINAFQARAMRYEKYGFTYSQVSSGKELVQTLIDATALEGSIKSVIIFAHGGPNQIYLNWNSGLYKTASDIDAPEPDARTLTQALTQGNIVFEKNARIIFGSCNAGREDGLAENITMATGVTTIGASGAVAPEIVNGKETGRLVTFKHDENDPAARFYKIEKKEVEKSFNFFGKEIKYKTQKIVRTDLGTTIDPKDYR